MSSFFHSVYSCELSRGVREIEIERERVKERERKSERERKESNIVPKLSLWGRPVFSAQLFIVRVTINRRVDRRRPNFNPLLHSYLLTHVFFIELSHYG